ncbi:hypothetical protein ACTXGO_02470 [Psychrobacter sp. T6-1]|uniref:hypothetical protein n=1 Tax=Psychrobacter sp. T6-1 TaxID=3457447 RepID=UPI003FD3C6FE
MENEESLFTLEGLKVENLKAAKIDKDVLIEIYRDYIKNQEILKQQAEYFANILHLGEEINSVKRRVKDPLHLLTKIVRKRRKAIEDKEDSPYLDISVDNYKSIVNDLVGIRAIYLFKENWALVNNFILDHFSVCKDEKITINHAIDDDLSFYLESGGMSNDYNYELEERVSRYRSTHYIISGISPQVFKFELQTRTILDEAWGEIDHHIRYPDFEHNEDLKRKMSILNGAISGCEELTSNFFKDFNELRIKINNESELLDDESPSEPSSTQEETSNSRSNVTEFIEDSAKVTDELWDRLIESAEIARAKERLLKSKEVVNHRMINEKHFKNSKKMLENYLLRGIVLNLEGNPNIKKSEHKKPSTSIHQYKKMIGDVSKDIPIKKDDEEEGED